MSGNHSRTKGARSERELCKLLSDELGIEVRRNVDQARAGGADCLMVPGYAIECKRCERLEFPKWWRQAIRQGSEAGLEAIVFYRQSRKPWAALMLSCDPKGYRQVDLHEALDAMRDKLARLYGIYREAA